MFRHVVRGLCLACWGSDNEQRDKAHNSQKLFRRRLAPISFDDLRRGYLDEFMSTSDLARRYKCSRQHIYKLLKVHGIEARDYKTRLNRSFFKFWSPAMAYVLGVIFTDGNIMPGRERDSKYKTPGSRLSIAQKDPELLEKVLALMECDAKISRGKQALTGNPIHTFNITLNAELYDDLLNLGLTPRKSRTMQFPKIPEPFVRHFIRGCWDGDGSVYLERGRMPRASYVTGSRQFADEMIEQLVNLGLPMVKLHSYSDRYGFYFRFGTVAACTRLYHVFYDDVPKSMSLSRKFDRFRAIAMDREGVLADEVIRRQNQRSEPADPIPVKSGGWNPQDIVHNPTRDVAEPKIFVPPPHKQIAPREKPILAFPEPFTRSMLAKLLAISPQQVERIMQSTPIVSNIYKLSRLKDLSSKEFRDGVRELKSEVNQFLFGWDGEGWDDLD